MSERLIKNIIASCSIIILATGTLMSIHSVKNYKHTKTLLKLRLAEFKQLQSIDSDIAQYREAKKNFEDKNYQHPIRTDSIIKKTMAGQNPQDTRKFTIDVDPDWLCTGAELSFEDASLDNIIKLINLAENSAPPWHMLKCTIRALPVQTVDHAHVILQFESLEKK